MMDEMIRSILAQHGRLSADVAQLDDEADLYRVGLTSHASVNVMLALEDAFDVEVPDTMLRKATFQSIGAIRSMIDGLTTHAESA
jgi:acyl carrier protein